MLACIESCCGAVAEVGVAVMKIAGGLGASAAAGECEIGMVEFNTRLRPYVLELKGFRAGKGNRSWIWELFSRRYRSPSS